MINEGSMTLIDDRSFRRIIILSRIFFDTRLDLANWHLVNDRFLGNDGGHNQEGRRKNK